MAKAVQLKAQNTYVGWLVAVPLILTGCFVARGAQPPIAAFEIMDTETGWMIVWMIVWSGQHHPHRTQTHTRIPWEQR